MSRPPLTPGSLPLADALQQSAALALLLRRLQESKARFEAIRPCLPAGLIDQLRPGPLDDTHWTLLCASGAAAAKLRQLLPRFEATLLDAGWQRTSIRVKVQSPGA